MVQGGVGVGRLAGCDGGGHHGGCHQGNEGDANGWGEDVLHAPGPFLWGGDVLPLKANGGTIGRPLSGSILNRPEGQHGTDRMRIRTMDHGWYKAA